MKKDYEASDGGTLFQFLQDSFCRVSAPTASKFCDEIGVTSRTRIVSVEPPQIEKLYQVFQEARLAPPPTDCLAPIGVRQMLAGMLKGVKADFMPRHPVSRMCIAAGRFRSKRRSRSEAN